MTSKLRGDAELPPGPARDLVALLRLLRGRAPLSIGQISVKSQLAAGHVSEVLRGWKAPSPNAAEAIAVALGADQPTALRARRLADALGELNRHTRQKERAVAAADPRSEPPIDIPPPPSHFVGRIEQIAQIAAAVRAARSPHRAAVVQIHGAPGIGKTALAFAAAHELLSGYPDGCLFVDFAAVDDPSALFPRLLARLGVAVPNDPGEAQALYLSHLYRRSVLVVADNVTRPEQATQLVAASPTCALISVSRRRLESLDDCCSVDLAPLNPTEAIQLLTSLLEPQDSPPRTELARIAARCAGVPAAIRDAVGEAVDPSPRVGGYLPSPASEVFVGRGAYVSELLTLWREHTGSLIQIIADGGTGKTTLVRRWLDVLDADERPWDLRWSFYSQGSHREAVDSAAFFDFAAHALGIDPAALAPGERRRIGALVARAFAARGGVLVLDGVEPLQHPPSVESGAVADPVLHQMLQEFREILRSDNHRGHFLVVITTRWVIPHLRGPGLVTLELPPLSAQEGSDLLRQVQLPSRPDAQLQWRPDPHRTAAEMVATSREFAGHPLALTLLATYLLTAEDGDLARRATIPPVAEFPADIAGYSHARRVMGAYDRLFQRSEMTGWNEACRQLLRVIGLFDRPAEPRLVDALCRPSITGLTDQLAGAGRYSYAVTRLRDLRLIAPADPTAPEDLDTHPLIREHFGRAFERDDPEVWTRAHARLARTLERSVVPVTPTTVPEMLTLYRAVAHGCRSGEFAWSWSVFTERVQQHDRFTSTGKLGLTVAEVSALSGFFRTPWHEIADGIPTAVVGKALGRAAFSLRAVGRLRDASSAFEAALAHHERCGDLQAAADDANNYSVGLLQAGDLPRAVEMATRALRYTEKSGGGPMMVKRHVNLAWLLHYEGRTAEAREGFREALRLLRKHRPDQPRLRSTQGQRYGEFLLEADPKSDNLREAAAIGQGMIDHPTVAYETLDAAMGYMIRGRAESLLLAAGLDSLKQSEDLSRQTGHRDALVRCLLPLAAASRIAGDTPGAARYLAEAEEIVEQYEMRLYLVDCALEHAWLALAQGDTATATECLGRARALRARHAPAYGRHDRTFTELESRCAGR